MADALSAVSANSAGVRATLRERSRYEIANNSYARGNREHLRSLHDGQRTNTPAYALGETTTEIAAALRKVEKLWANWAYVRRLSQKLHTMVQAAVGDGEGFALMTTNERPTMHTPCCLTSASKNAIGSTTGRKSE